MTGYMIYYQEEDKDKIQINTYTDPKRVLKDISAFAVDDSIQVVGVYKMLKSGLIRKLKIQFSESNFKLYFSKLERPFQRTSDSIVGKVFVLSKHKGFDIEMFCFESNEEFEAYKEELRDIPGFKIEAVSVVSVERMLVHTIFNP